MKEFVKKWMLVFALIVVAVFIIMPLNNGSWELALFILQLLSASLITCLLQLLTDQAPLRSFLAKYLLDYVMVLATVLLLGVLYHWYTPGSILFIIISATLAFAAAILLDLVQVKRDMDAINRQILLRRRRSQEDDGNDS